jgi:hypothetical protein
VGVFDGKLKPHVCELSVAPAYSPALIYIQLTCQHFRAIILRAPRRRLRNVVRRAFELGGIINRGKLGDLVVIQSRDRRNRTK